MPNFDRLHDLSSRLAKLTAPGEQEPGLASWCLAVGPLWRDIAEMWDSSPPSWALETRVAALEGRVARIEPAGPDEATTRVFRHPFEPGVVREHVCYVCGAGKDHPIHQEGGTHAR
jgi:hypothetical protein